MNCTDFDCTSDHLLSLNATCACMPLDAQNLQKDIAQRHDQPNLTAALSNKVPFFASTGVFVSQNDVTSMKEQIAAIEAAIKTRTLQQKLLSRGDSETVHLQQQSHGLLMGYDFHLSPAGPKLIEINTNAGGAFLVSELLISLNGEKNTNSSPLTMFLKEWQTNRKTPAPHTLAIIDAAPREQFLYADMLLAKTTLEEHGIQTFIADPKELSSTKKGLFLGEVQIDMVYNRLTDFKLHSSENNALRQALIQDQAVISPAPRHHALYADKRNFVDLIDETNLREAHLTRAHKQALQLIPSTQEVRHCDENALWQSRRQLFFKPAHGYASKAVYRGDKITRRVWDNVLSRDYIAQSKINPGLRKVSTVDIDTSLKFDVRAYTYQGAPLLYAARMYQGQTTNFRTRGGGFAPVVIIDEDYCSI